MKKFQCGRFCFDLSAEQRPLVMGILNVTPDSFSDGGKYVALDKALQHAQEMIDSEVDIIDIGAESSRPGSQPVSVQEELDRIMPVVEALADCGKAISIDTYKPEVMIQTLAAGADMINDICGFASSQSIAAVSQSTCGLCIMHMQGDPQTMQEKPKYTDVFDEVSDFLSVRVNELSEHGVSHDRMCIDPGFGFGKSVEDNICLLKCLPNMVTRLRLPILAGLSRKSIVGALTGKPVEQRLAGNLAIALVAANYGARILRVHDVAQTVDAVRVWQQTR